jgi:AcrR family transcriptional regulator
MIEIVAACGYERMKVRDIVRRAGVSTRAFYELFKSKEDCFLKTYEHVAWRATQRAISAQSAEPSWRKRLHRVFDTVATQLESDPYAARLALIEAYAAGPEALEKAWHAERTFEAMIAESFARAPSGIEVPPLVVEGMVAGAAKVARARLLDGRAEELTGLGDELIEWACCYPGSGAASLLGLDTQISGKYFATRPPVKEIPAMAQEQAGYGDRTAIIDAVGKAVAEGGYRSLTAPQIRRAAGVSPKAFDANFDGVEDCFIVALEQRATTALTRAAVARTAGSTWVGGVHRMIASLCVEIVEDPILVSACLRDEFAPGSAGSLCRQRLISAVVEQLIEAVPADQRPSGLASEASEGAIWALFHHHVVRAATRPAPHVPATISFMALAPAKGADEAFEAIAAEQ